MTYILFIIKNAFEDFRRNKIRTLLTSLGILIGVASVVLLTAFGLGLKKYIQQQFDNLGTNIIIILPGKILQNGSFSGGAGTFGGIRFDEKDVQNLKKLKTIEYIVPALIKSISANANGKSEYTSIYLTNEEVFPARNFEIQVGIKFSKNDVDKKSKVVVIGPKLAEKLFGTVNNSVGKIIKIENQAYRVIGVIKAKGGGGLGGPDFDMYVFGPYTASQSLNQDNKFSTINLKSKNSDFIEQTKEESQKILLKRYKKDEFSVIEQTEILGAVSSIFNVLNTILIAIAAISLIVGGIGIMNIMYVSVVERIKEIGIRRSMGATRNDILIQFLSEAIILSLIGGLLGLFISFLLVLVVQRFFPAYINIQSIVTALGVSSFIGIFFGVFPARKAASLSPIDAIRYE